MHEPMMGGRTNARTDSRTDMQPGNETEGKLNQRVVSLDDGGDPVRRVRVNEFTSE